jgi:hypothetical protein
MKTLAWLSTAFVLAFAPACGSSNGAGSDAGDNGDDGGGGINCVGIGEACEANVECCGGKACEPDGAGGKRCTDTSFCVAGGGACDQASECCSLSCNGSCQTDGGLCKPADTDCASDQECCSNICDGTCQKLGTACATLGEVCSSEGVDQDCCSLNCQNFGSGSDPDLRCARSSSCGARGEICVVDNDCCSGVCDGGRCPTQSQVGGQRFAGEPCLKDSDCASYACASEFVGGPKVCQFLGGCRPAGEICSDSFQCCSDLLLLDGAPGEHCTIQGEGTGCVAHGGVDGLALCDLQEGPKEVGEICFDTEGTKVHECCPTDSCAPTLTGVWRCSGPGGFDECVPDGQPCQVADQCCSKICAPHETDNGTELLCGPCVPVDGLCTTSADCCSQTCVNGACSEDESECVPLGGMCTMDSDCCSGFCHNGACTTIQID